MRKHSFILTLAILGTASAAPGADVPSNLVIDFRLWEMRSSSPNFQVMSELSFFVDTDGAGITEPQWLATVARQVPDAFLASLAFGTVPVDGTTAAFAVETRTRRFELSVDVGSYLAQGTFPASLQARLKRNDDVLREFASEIELRSGQTFVMSSHDLELSASDYLSHFRDYESTEHRGAVYDYLRNYTVFVIVALTPRIVPEGIPDRVEVHLAEDVELPELANPTGVRLVGTIELTFDVDAAGVPQEIRVARSSIPEVNPRIVGAADSWRFPQAAGRAARLVLSLESDP